MIVYTQGFGASTAIADFVNGGVVTNNPSGASNSQVPAIGTSGVYGDNYLNFTTTNANQTNVTCGIPLPAAYTTFYVGMHLAVQNSNSTINANSVFLYDSAGAIQLEARFNITAGSISLYRGSTLLGTSATNVWSNNLSWFFFEFGGVINASTGSATLRVNGTSVLSVTGTNTANTANLNIAQIVFQLSNTGNNGAVTIRASHVYVCDNTTSQNNTFLGDIRVQHIGPTGAGSTTNFTPTGASTNYAVAATNPPVPATKYNSDSNAGDQDLFTFSGVAAGATVLGVTVKSYLAKSSPGTRTMTNVLRSGSTTGSGTARGVNGTPTYSMDCFNLDPNGGIAFTASAVNSMQFGYSIVT